MLSHKPRHRAATPVFSARTLVGASAALAGATAVAVALSGGSLALWTDGAPVNAGSVSAGTVGLSTASAFNSALWSNRLVGETVRQEFTVTNTGNVPLTISAAATAAAAGFEVRVVRATCGGTPLTGPSATVSPTALGSLAVGATATVCLELAVVTGASAATSSAFSVTVTGVQS